MDLVLFSLLHQTTKELKEIAKALGYYKGLHVESTGDTTIDIKSDILFVEGIPLQNIDLDLDLSNTGANGRDEGDLASGDIWFIFVITNDTGSNIASYASKTTANPDELTLPSGYTKARLVSFCKLDDGVKIWTFCQVGRNYTYYGYIRLFNDISLPNVEPYLSYNVSDYTPPSVCEEVEIVLYCYGTESTNDIGMIMQQGYEVYESGSIRNDISDYLYGWLPINDDTTIEFKSSNGATKGSGFVKGARLKI